MYLCIMKRDDGNTNSDRLKFSVAESLLSSSSSSSTNSSSGSSSGSSSSCSSSCGSSNADAEHNKKIDRFVQWMKSSNTQFPKLTLKDYGSEVRGCHATKSINEDEIIILVPLKCLITVEMGKDTDIGRIVQSSNLELDAPKHIYLMLFMLIDSMDSSSFFKPYYDILPATLSNMPIFWNEYELSLLTGSYVLQQIRERNVAIENDYTAICKVAPTFGNICTLDRFKWARMCVCSRNFGLIINGLRTAALVPYADMLNHYRPRETKWQFDDSLQGFTITAMQTITAGQQIYDSYGQKCNHRFLLNYGFSVEHNVEPDGFCPNEVPVLLSLIDDDPYFTHKCTIGIRDPCFPSRRIRILIGDNENRQILLNMLRVIVCDKSELEYVLEYISHSATFRTIRDLGPISVNNEMQSMKKLISVCESYLREYPTSYQEDMLRLADTAVLPFSNERHALIQVVGEKVVLLHYRDLAVQTMQLLKLMSDAHELSIELQKLKESGDHVMYKHCSGIIAMLKRTDDSYITGDSNSRSRQSDLSVDVSNVY